MSKLEHESVGCHPVPNENSVAKAEEVLEGEILTVNSDAGLYMEGPFIEEKTYIRGNRISPMLLAAAAMSVSIGSFLGDRSGISRAYSGRDDWNFDDPIESFRLTSPNARGSYSNNLSRQLTKKSKKREEAHDEKREARKRQRDARKKNRRK